MFISLQPAASYADALRLVEGYPGGRARVVGLDPFHTPVPLDRLDSLWAVHDSPTRDARAEVTGAGTELVPPALVRIFEYRPAADRIR